MRLLEDFASYFATAGLTTDWAVFADGFLDTPDNAISINEYGNSLPNPLIQGSTRQIQIVVRSKLNRDAKQKAQQLFMALHTAEDKIMLTSERWAQLFVRNTPFKMKVDEHKRVYYVFNMACTTFIGGI